MKKIYYILLVAFAMISVSCVNRIEEVFETPASERLNANLRACKELLTSPEHGWLIRYYPSREREWGGCTYAAKFETNGDVSVASDVADWLDLPFGEVRTSHYSIKSSTSAVLSFDTYNHFIHYWADPDIPRQDKMYGGDLEFFYVEGDENHMVFRGTKSGNQIVFTPLEQDIVTTIKSLEPCFRYTTENLYDGFNFNDGNGNSVRVTKHRYYNRLYLDNQSMPYALIPGGIEFYEPVTVGGATFKYLAWMPGTEENMGTLTSVDAVSESGAPVNITLEGVLHDHFTPYETFLGKYKMKAQLEDTIGEEEFDLEIVEREKNVSFTLKGLRIPDSQLWGQIYPGKPFELKLDFDPFDGAMRIMGQYICNVVSNSDRNNDFEVWIMACDQYRWVYWPYESVGLTLRHNNDPDNFQINWDVRDEPGKENSFLFGRYKDGGMNNGGEWLYSQGALTYLKPLIKYQ